MTQAGAVLDPLPCINCGRMVFWYFNGHRWTLLERLGTYTVSHRCAA